MTPKDQSLIERRARKLLDVKQRFVDELKQAAHDCGARCIVDADERFCFEKLRDAALISRLGRRAHVDLIDSTIREGLQEGKALADKTLADRWRDPWETQLADIPARLIHRAPSGRDLVLSSDLLEHYLGVPSTPAGGKRLAPVMKLNGWNRHKSGLVKVGGQNYKGYWRWGEVRT